MGILIWIVLGAVAGWIASLIMKSSSGLLMDIVVGIVGALLGGWVMNILGESGVTGFNLYSVAVAVLGALILIAILRAVRK